MRKSLLTLIFLTFCSYLLAQQSMNNDSIIKLMNAGLSDELIVATIKATPGIYNTSPDALIALKTAGISEKIISAVVLKGSGSPSAPDAKSTTAPESTSPGLAPPAEHFANTPATSQPVNGPRVYLSSASKGSQWNAARDQSMEMSKDFEKDCPGVRVTINQAVADYSVLLNHIEHGFARDNQIQIANKQGDLISRTKEGGSINGNVKKACEIILADWAKK